MRRNRTVLFLLLLGLFSLKESDAATYTSTKGGNWSDPSTWDLNMVPGMNDDVVINGHEVIINGSTAIDLAASVLEINSLSIYASSGVGTMVGGLSISGGVQLGVLGDVYLNVTDNFKYVALDIDGAGTDLKVAGNIYFMASAANKVFLKVLNNASLKLAGNFSRPNEFGNIYMDSNTTIEFRGTNAQSIPTENASGDSIDLANVVLNNSAGIILTEPLEVEGDLNLTKGNIISSTANPVIIGDMATITGGSEDAYIEGPVRKLGRTDNSGFAFPIGNATTYAPMRISRVSNASSDFTALYKGDPPPFGVFENSIDRVDETQHWELTKTAASDDVTVMLAWQDGASSQLSNIDSVIVVGLKDEGTPSATWQNFGQQSATGGVNSGESGTVLSLDGDPPPFGVFKFTVGSGAPTTSLPVELIKFGVQDVNGKANLFWKTASEINSERYQIERSQDGNKFNKIGFVRILGDSETVKTYQYNDMAPTSGTNYYRLRIVDLDGSYEYSDVVTIDLGNEPILEISPNPVTDIMTISTGAEVSVSEGTVEIFDQAGTLIGKSNITLTEGKSTINVSEMNANTPGVYYIRISESSSSKVLKFMKID
ncbi:MAG: T9SS type A sorting domain-containing protein [Saprospiraceae bacterium]